jgi:predicted amidophosphoribosyltransferase
MVLCAGCRVGVCCATIESDSGCAKWSEHIENEDFVYYCPYCARDLKVANQVCHVESSECVYTLTIHSQLTLRKEIPRKNGLWFRYDPPVMIIGINWHEKSTPFSELLHKRLALVYDGYMENVRG